MIAWGISYRDFCIWLFKISVRCHEDEILSMRMSADRVLEYGQMSAEAKLKELGYTLPELPTPGGNYLPAKVIGGLVFLAGVISSDENGVMTGIVGSTNTVQDGYLAARHCALTQLAVLKQALGSLDRVKQVVSVNGYVNTVSGFGESPQVINGASDLLVEIFGESGRHVRAAVGVSALPRKAMVELQMTVEI
jgi:enamine deaminase RidA (YjgF/YER057c/UK114 family)